MAAKDAAKASRHQTVYRIQRKVVLDGREVWEDYPDLISAFSRSEAIKACVKPLLEEDAGNGEGTHTFRAFPISSDKPETHIIARRLFHEVVR